MVVRDVGMWLTSTGSSDGWYCSFLRIDSVKMLSAVTGTCWVASSIYIPSLKRTISNTPSKTSSSPTHQPTAHTPTQILRLYNPPFLHPLSLSHCPNSSQQLLFTSPRALPPANRFNQEPMFHPPLQQRVHGSIFLPQTRQTHFSEKWDDYSSSRTVRMGSSSSPVAYIDAKDIEHLNPSLETPCPLPPPLWTCRPINKKC
jgi:hypothetical protein